MPSRSACRTCGARATTNSNRTAPRPGPSSGEHRRASCSWPARWRTSEAAVGARVFVQDRWTLDNLTLNLGLRYDYHNAYVPAQDIGALPFVGPKHYDAFPDAPSWKDLSPRLGCAWDITGKGKSVVRLNYGHYLASESTATATANNPVNTRINSATRVVERYQPQLRAGLRSDELAVQRRMRDAQCAVGRSEYRDSVG